MAATLKDIADHLNLSISTVSYALNGGPKPVSTAVRESVIRKAAELGYRPNRIAKSLVTRRTYTLGVVPVAVDVDFLLYPNVLFALNGIFNAAAQTRQDLMIFTAHDRNKSNAIAHDLLDSRIDGVVFVCPRSDSEAIKHISQTGLPFTVVLDGSISPHFTMDNAAGAKMALQHLYDLGHRLIAHVSGDFGIEDGVIRHRAYLEFMRDHELEIHPGYVIPGNYWLTAGFAAGRKYVDLKPRPTAVFCANDGMAIGFLDAMAEYGLECPKDVSVIGFDDAPPGGPSPVLTSIRQPLGEMAAAAVHALVRQIETGIVPESRQFGPTLIVRSSTGPASTSP
jgi:DNA-binding LacI/PurR family transcriptional regulator